MMLCGTRKDSIIERGEIYIKGKREIHLNYEMSFNISGKIIMK